MSPAPTLPRDAPSSAVFYGWKIVAVSFLTLFVSVGFGFYSFGPFFKALAEELGGSRFGVGVGLALFSITNGLAAPFLARAISRGAMKSVMTAGVCLLALGFVVISRVQSLWQFYAVLATLLALGAALLGGLPTSTLVANWFVRKRGMALGIATMGISLSGVVMAPAATWLIATVGWRSTFVIYGALTLLIVLPVVRAFVIDSPEDAGLHPDGDAEEPVEAFESHASGSVYTWRAALADRNFWAIAGAVSLSMSANGAILTHVIPHATDLGYSPPAAAFVLSTMAALGVLGKVVWGYVSDRYDKRAAVYLSFSLQGVAAVIFLFARSYPALLFGGAVFGLGMGGLMPLWGTLIGASFGRRAFGRVMGLMTPIMLPIQTLGVPVAGLLYDRAGNYDQAFALFIGVYASSLVALGFLRLPARGAAAPEPRPAVG